MKIQPLPGFQGLVVVRGDWVRQNLVAPLYFGNRAPRRVRNPEERTKYYDRPLSNLFQQIKYCYLWLTKAFVMDVNKLMFALALVLLVAWIAGATP